MRTDLKRNTVGTGSKVWHVTGTAIGSKYLGEVRAETGEEAVQLAYDFLDASVILCHQCSSECSDGEVTDLVAECHETNEVYDEKAVGLPKRKPLEE
jgi:hypothetical protein